MPQDLPSAIILDSDNGSSISFRAWNKYWAWSYYIVQIPNQVMSLYPNLYQLLLQTKCWKTPIATLMATIAKDNPGQYSLVYVVGSFSETAKIRCDYCNNLLVLFPKGGRVILNARRHAKIHSGCVKQTKRKQTLLDAFMSMSKKCAIHQKGMQESSWLTDTNSHSKCHGLYHQHIWFSKTKLSLNPTLSSYQDSRNKKGGILWYLCHEKL